MTARELVFLVEAVQFGGHLRFELLVLAAECQQLVKLLAFTCPGQMPFELGRARRQTGGAGGVIPGFRLGECVLDRGELSSGRGRAKAAG